MTAAGRAPRATRTVSKQALRLLLYIEMLIVDCAAIVGGWTIASRINGTHWVSPNGVNLAWLLLPIYLLMAFNRHAYSIEALGHQAESVRRAIISMVLTMMVILMVTFFMQTGDEVSRLGFTAGWLGSLLLLVVGRFVFHYYAANRYDGTLTDELLILDGVSADHSPATRVVDAKAERLEPDLNNPAMLNRLATCLVGFDRVVIACPPERQNSWSLVLKGANIQGEILLQGNSTVGVIGIDKFGEAETLIVSRGPLSMTNRAKKRLLDLAFTVPALIALSPLLILVAIAIKLESKGPVFFKQQRVGRANRLFNILKFRSMRVEQCDADGAQSTQRDDDRITRVGAIIRKTSIDELPQLINVLLGDMSLVGPRPHALGSLAGDKLFWEIDQHYWLRHALKPGMTGLAQIRGFRGATMQREDLEKRLGADLEYVNGWRLWRDVSILFATVKVLVHPNAY